MEDTTSPNDHLLKETIVRQETEDDMLNSGGSDIKTFTKHSDNLTESSTQQSGNVR